MAQPATERLLTAEEFMRLPDPPTGERFELIDGKVCLVPPVGASHSDRSGLVWLHLRQFAHAHGLGHATVEGSYLLQRDPDRVVTPDAAFVRGEKLVGGVLPDTYVPVPPDLAVEVKSPTDRERDILVKIGRYFAAGTSIVWVVRSENRSVTVYRPDADPLVYGENETLTSVDAGFEVDGFSLPVAALFR